jgi:AbiV family abortive infection protein
MSSKTERPRPEKQLFENLFAKPSRDESLQIISQGLAAFADNAGRLLEDASILLKAERLASSQFLITTADEEMAKSYILLDACRLDLAHHTSVLRRLCRAFYDHIIKYAYNQNHKIPRLT